jgi:hypothetical protein
MVESLFKQDSITNATDSQVNGFIRGFAATSPKSRNPKPAQQINLKYSRSEF